MVAALDIYMRLGLGQIHMVAEMVADGSIPIKAAACKVGSLETPEMGCTLMSWNQPYRLVPFG
jgi:hypothetical protein